MLSHCPVKMALGEIEKSKNVKSSKTGFLFFLLLQMSLLSKVWPEDPPPIVQDPTTTVQDTSTTAQDTSPTVQDTSPTVQDTSPTVQDTSPTVQDTSPTVQDTSPTVQDTSPTVQDTSPTVQDTSPTVQDTSPTVQDTSTTVQDTSTTAQHTTTTVQDTSKTQPSGRTETTTVTHSMHPESSSSTTSTGQMSAVATAGSTLSNTQSMSYVSNAVSSMGSTNMNKDNSTSETSGNYSMISCPVFDCTTDCYAQLMNATMTSCPSSNFCEIMTQNTSYSVKCSASCGVSCGNSTLTNCSWKCCNTTSCLDDALLGLTSSLSTTATTTSTTTRTTTKTMAPSTQANNGKKCHSIKCDGAACYKSITTSMLCPVGQDYCMLKKTTSGSVESWHAGCSEDCRKMTVCSTSVTTCYLECCNATSTASCLKLTGDVNMPSSATRGPHSPALLIASLLLFWILRVFT
ncbi:mucin-5AC isoform X2 [Pimephales promelas]|uniref:mucin-5AC isoform X2 n=1 Tax=Pimephales promelas TaxID=90988 RepID=UPI001955C1ED|nr:mucin-5AC isoform X2 [Pimephales promelas]